MGRPADRSFAAETLRGYGADGADVGGDVFADGPVAAGDAALQLGGAVARWGVEQGKREAVELELADVAYLFAAGQGFAHASIPGTQIGLTVGIVEREHGAGVGRLDEAVAGLAADALGRGVGRDEFGMRGFERAQAVHERSRTRRRLVRGASST